jgi:hypothetical protein
LPQPSPYNAQYPPPNYSDPWRHVHLPSFAESSYHIRPGHFPPHNAIQPTGHMHVPMHICHWNQSTDQHDEENNYPWQWSYKSGPHMIPSIHPYEWHSSEHAPAREWHRSAPPPTGHSCVPPREWHPSAPGQNLYMSPQEWHQTW